MGVLRQAGGRPGTRRNGRRQRTASGRLATALRHPLSTEHRQSGCSVSVGRRRSVGELRGARSTRDRLPDRVCPAPDAGVVRTGSPPGESVLPRLETTTGDASQRVVISWSLLPAFRFTSPGCASCWSVPDLDHVPGRRQLIVTRRSSKRFRPRTPGPTITSVTSVRSRLRRHSRPRSDHRARA